MSLQQPSRKARRKPRGLIVAANCADCRYSQLRELPFLGVLFDNCAHIIYIYALQRILNPMELQMWQIKTVSHGRSSTLALMVLSPLFLTQLAAPAHAQLFLLGVAEEGVAAAAARAAIAGEARAATGLVARGYIARPIVPRSIYRLYKPEGRPLVYYNRPRFYNEAPSLNYAPQYNHTQPIYQAQTQSSAGSPGSKQFRHMAASSHAAIFVA